MNKIVDYSGANYVKAVQASFESTNDLVVVRGVLPLEDIDGILVNPSRHAEYFGQTALSSQIDHPFTTKLIPIFDQRAKEVEGELIRHDRQNKRIDGELAMSLIVNLSASTGVFAQRIAESTDSQDIIESQFEKWKTGSGKLLNGSLVRKGDGVIIPRGVVYATQGLGKGKSLVVSTKQNK